jgi:hypothetical protein
MAGPIFGFDAPTLSTRGPIFGFGTPTSSTRGPVFGFGAPMSSTRGPVVGTYGRVSHTRDRVALKGAPFDVTRSRVSLLGVSVREMDARVRDVDAPIRATRTPVRGEGKSVPFLRGPFDVIPCPVRATRAAFALRGVRDRRRDKRLHVAGAVVALKPVRIDARASRFGATGARVRVSGHHDSLLLERYAMVADRIAQSSPGVTALRLGRNPPDGQDR